MVFRICLVLLEYFLEKNTNLENQAKCFRSIVHFFTSKFNNTGTFSGEKMNYGTKAFFFEKNVPRKPNIFETPLKINIKCIDKVKNIATKTSFSHDI